MSETPQLPMPQRLIKHILLWIVFAYCYQNAISLLVTMANDAQPDHVILTAFLYALGFNILTAHLVTKYDTYWPVIAAAFIALVGLVVIPLLLFGTSGLLSFPLLAGILFTLPLCTYVVGLIKVKHSKN
jgi:peptidoglycan/LPS O-acetylase OafA/YrhL